MHGRDKDVQRYLERGSDSGEPEPASFGLVEAVLALGEVKPVKPGSAGDSEPSNAARIASTLVLPALTPTQQRRRAAFKAAAALSVALHAGSFYAFLAWHGSADTGALDRPSDAISIEIVESLTIEAREARQASEPAPSVEATAPTEGSTEASDAQPLEPERKVEPEPHIVVPQPPLVIPDAQEQVMRAVKREAPAQSETPPVPEQGPTQVVPPPPNSGSSEDDAPATRKPQKQEVREQASPPAPKGGQISKSSDGKGRGGERVSASSGAMLSYAAEVRARVAGNKPSGGGLRGTAVVAFGISHSGGLTYAGLARSSGDPQLDLLAIAAVRGSAPFPPPPAGATSAQLRFSIPFHFQ